MAEASPEIALKGSAWADQKLVWKKWWSRKNLSFTAIDIDGSVLRMAQAVRRKGRAEIVRFAAKDLDAEIDGEHPAALGRAVAQAFKEFKIKPTLPVMGLPRGAVLLRTLSMPIPNNPGEMAAMIHFQFGKDLPFAPEDAVIDFNWKPSAPETPETSAQTVKPDPGASHESSDASTGRIDVLAAAVRMETIDKYRLAAQTAGFELAALGLRSHAHARCIEACGVANSNDDVALLSLRSDEIIIDVLRSGSLVFSRTAPVQNLNAENAGGVEARETDPGGDGDGASALDPFVRRAVIEVIRSLHSYAGMDQQGAIRKLIVVGSTGFESVTASALSARINLPCELLDPARMLHLNASDNQHATGALAVIGLALGAADPQGLPFDFLHPKRPPPLVNRKRIAQVVGSVFACLAIVSAFGARSHVLSGKLQIKNELQRQLAAEQKNDRIYRQARQQAKSVQDWIQSGQPWVEHLALLSALLPPRPDLYVTAFSTTSRGSLQLSVQARTAEILNAVDKTLRAAGYGVKPLALTPAPDKFGYPFKSSLDLSIPAGKKFDFASLRQLVALPIGEPERGGFSSNASQSAVTGLGATDPAEPKDPAVVVRPPQPTQRALPPQVISESETTDSDSGFGTQTEPKQEAPPGSRRGRRSRGGGSGRAQTETPDQP